MSFARASAAFSQLVILTGFVAHLAVGLVLTVLLGRALSPEDFGFFALLAAAFAFARDATDLGTTSTAARDMRRDPARERPLVEGLYLWRRTLGIVLGLGVLGLAFAQADPARRWVLVAAAGSLALMGPPAFLAVFQARQAQLAPTFVTLASQVLLLAGCLALLAAGIHGPAVGALVVLREVLTIVGLAVAGILLVGYRPAPGFTGRGLRAFAASAGLWALAAACRHLYGQMDVLAVYLFRGEAELGALAAAYRPMSPAFVIPWLATAPLVPVLALAFAEDAERYRRLVGESLRLATGAGALVAVCGVVLAGDLVAMLYGGRYLAAPMDSTAAMVWLALAVLPVHWMAVGAVALLAAGREKVALVIMAAGLVLKIAANLALVPTHGFVVATLSTAIMEFGVALALWVAVAGLRAPTLPSRATVASLLPAAAVALASPLVVGSPAARVAILLAVGAAGFAALMVSPVGRDYLGELKKASV